ncbi:MAG TPA: SOS response-associated peptidase [Cyclobacteriaceae bacterium]|nr:SOS response-associated peptidase [Cyclobacteriaceae bacterium]HRJ82096.1 SOS response-associated peptidase [Cyclobacteriaceae bacterium]
MIERYTLTVANEKIAERFSADVPEFYAPRYNAAPTQLLPVITSGAPQGLSLFYWGRPPQWARNKSLSERIINLRTETLLERPVLKKALMKFRCIVPADGFYAWKKLGKKTAIPYRFVTDQDVFSFAGLWEEFEDEGGAMVHTFTIITTAANETVSRITDRMPVILNKQREAVWLNQKATEADVVEQLSTYPSDKLSLYPVSPRINEIKTDVPSLIIPTPPADQHGNLTLFD